MNREIMKIFYGLLSIMLVLGVFSFPHKADAAGAATGIDPVNQLKQYVLDPIAWMMADAMVQQVTQHTVDWINSDFESGNPLSPANYQDFFRNTADNASVMFLDSVTNGKFSNLFCEPFRYKIGLSIPQTQPFELKAKCTLSDVQKTAEFYQDFSKGGWATWLEVSRPENNPYGVILMTLEEQQRVKAAAADEQKLDLNLGKGFLSIKKCVEYDTLSGENCTYQNGICVPNEAPPCKRYENTTPGAIIADRLNSSLDLSSQRLIQADELSEIIGSLIGYAFRKVETGIFKQGRTAIGTSNYSPQQTIRSNVVDNTTPITPAEFKAILREMKFTLYDYRIIMFDTKFKPGNSNDPTDTLNYDPEAKAEYTALYKKLGKDYNNSNDFGILAGRREKQNNTFIYLGYDLVGSSPDAISPNDRPLKFYRNMGKNRIQNMLIDYANASVLASQANAEGSSAEVQCRIGSRNKKGGDAKSLIDEHVNNYLMDLREISEYFDRGGVYENLMESIRKAETAIQNVENNVGDQTDAQYIMQSSAESLLSLRKTMPNIFGAIARRVTDMTHYSITNPCTQEQPNAGLGYGEIYNEDGEEYTNNCTIYDGQHSKSNMHCWASISGDETSGTGAGGGGDAPYVKMGYTWDQCEAISGEYTGEDGYWYSERECKAYLTGDHANAANRCQIRTCNPNTPSTDPASCEKSECGFTSSNQVIDCLNQLRNNPSYSCSKSSTISNPSCGQKGGNYCSSVNSCPDGYSSLGDTYDCTPCCTNQ